MSCCPGVCCKGGGFWREEAGRGAAQAPACKGLSARAAWSPAWAAWVRLTRRDIVGCVAAWVGHSRNDTGQHFNQHSPQGHASLLIRSSPLLEHRRIILYLLSAVENRSWLIHTKKKTKTNDRAKMRARLLNHHQQTSANPAPPLQPLRCRVMELAPFIRTYPMETGVQFYRTWRLI